MRDYLVIGSGVILVIAIALFSFDSGIFFQNQGSSNEIQVHAKITGLEKGDNVDIVGGRIPENPPEGEYRLEDPFKITVKENGLTLLPINKEGEWEMEAAAVNYGEVPEFHRITVSEGDNRTLEWELRKMPSGTGTLIVKSNPSGCSFEIDVTPKTENIIYVENEIEGTVRTTPWDGYLPVGTYKVVWGEVKGYEKLYPTSVEIKNNRATVVVGDYVNEEVNTKISENKKVELLESRAPSSD